MDEEKGLGVGAIILVIILGAWAYNHYTAQKIDTDYGYKVETSGVTAKPDCASLAPQNTYETDSGHSAGFEWGASGHDCGGNSDSFIAGCQDYQNQENAYQYCLSRK